MQILLVTHIIGIVQEVIGAQRHSQRTFLKKGEGYVRYGLIVSGRFVLSVPERMDLIQNFRLQCSVAQDEDDSPERA